MFPNARSTAWHRDDESYELRDYPEAVQALDGALASTVRPLTDEQRTQVGELRERAAAFVGRYEVPAAPAGARLYLDGEHVTIEEGWPASVGHVLLGIGEHQVAIRLEDGRSSTSHVVVRGHTDGYLYIDTSGIESHDQPVTTTPPAADPPPTYTTVPPAPASTSVDPAPWSFSASASASRSAASFWFWWSVRRTSRTSSMRCTARGGARCRAPTIAHRSRPASAARCSASASQPLSWAWFGASRSSPRTAREQSVAFDVGLGSGSSAREVLMQRALATVALVALAIGCRPSLNDGQYSCPDDVCPSPLVCWASDLVLSLRSRSGSRERRRWLVTRHGDDVYPRRPATAPTCSSASSVRSAPDGGHRFSASAARPSGRRTTAACA